MERILITDGTVITMDSESPALSPAWLLIEGDRIEAVGSGEYPSDVGASRTRRINASGKLVVPGLINAHTHLCQGLMKNVSWRGPLSAWLESIRPYRLNMMPEDVKLSVKLSLVENVKNGITSIIHHHKVTPSDEHIDAAFEAIAEIGVRALFVLGVRNSDSPKAVCDRLEHLKKLASRTKDGRVRVGLGPTAPSTMSDRQIQSMAEISHSYRVPLHMHMSETREEVGRSLDVHGARPVERLNKLGCLSSSTELVHCVHVNEEEINMIAQSDAIVIHAPVSNLYLASGIAPVRTMLDRGIGVAIGTDGPASNNSQNLLESMKITALLANVYSFANAISPRQILNMTFRHGSSAMGDDRVGKISPGMAADITIVDQNGVGNHPNCDLGCSLISATGPSEINAVICDGKVLLENGSLLSCCGEDLTERSHEVMYRLNETIYNRAHAV